MYNPGEKFNGLTSPLYSYLVLATSYVLDYQRANIVVCAVFMVGASILCGICFANSAIEFLIISSVVASWSYFYATFGMETSLYLCLIGWSLYLLKRDSDRFVITLALLGATRNEGVFLAVPAFLYFYSRNRRLPRASSLILAFALFATPLIINFLYYGSPIPDTANAKIGQGSSGLWGERFGFLRVHYMKPWFFGGSTASMLLAPSLAAFGFLASRRSSTAWIAASFLTLLASFYLGLNIPNYHWYYAPFFYFMSAFATVGAISAWRELTRAPFFKARKVALVGHLGASVFVLVNVIDFEPKRRFEPYVNVAAWLEGNAEPKASVAAVEIGTLGWHCNRPIIDILGLVSPYNASFIASRDWYGWLTHYQPEYILRHTTPTPHERSIPLLEDRGFYTVTKEFLSDDLVLLKRSPSAPPDVIQRAAVELQRR